MNPTFSSSAPCPQFLSQQRHQQNHQFGMLNFQLLSRHPLSNSLASISLGSISSSGSPTPLLKASKVVEPHTGVSFPPNLGIAALAGLGVRAKKIFGLKTINVYALGIYVDKAGAQKVLNSKFSSSAGAASSCAVCDEVIAAEAVNKSLRLVITFGCLTRSQFLNALEERLRPPLDKAGEKKTLDAFRKQFDDVSLEKGTEIIFINAGKQLTTKVDGCNKGTLSSPALNSALLQVYLGPDPVAPDAKMLFGKAMEALLKPQPSASKP